MRKSWDQYFIDLASQVAERATCDRARVGTVIVRSNRIISTGYNGSIHGEGHCDEVGHLYNDQGRCIRTIHSEQNALLHAKEDLLGATAYVTHYPCENCSKLLVQAGITRIVYKEHYENKYSREFLKNIEVVHLQEQPQGHKVGLERFPSYIQKALQTCQTQHTNQTLIMHLQKWDKRFMDPTFSVLLEFAMCSRQQNDQLLDYLQESLKGSLES